MFMKMFHENINIRRKILSKTAKLNQPIKDLIFLWDVQINSSRAKFISGP